MRAVWLVALLALLGCRGAHAQVVCTAATSAVAFGNYQPLAATMVMTTGNVQITCNPGVVAIVVAYTIQLGVGGGTGYTARSMGGRTPRLGYQLYRDSGMTQIWGDGSGGTFTVTDGFLIGLIFPVVNNYTVYGRILASQPASVGAYTDSVLVTLTY